MLTSNYETVKTRWQPRGFPSEDRLNELPSLRVVSASSELPVSTPLSYSQSVDADSNVNRYVLRHPQAVMIADLQSLEEDTEMYDEDCIKPSPYAFARMRELLTCSLEYMRSFFPSGTVYPDGSGGLRVDWSRAEKELRLIVPSVEGRREYIWYLHDREHALIEDISAQTLGHWLDWLTQDDRRSAE